MPNYMFLPGDKGYNGHRTKITPQDSEEAVWNMLRSVPYDTLIEFCAKNLSKEDFVALVTLWSKYIDPYLF